MTRLIINADDFGYCEAVNYGIVSAYKNGALKSTTIMPNMPGFKQGVELLKDNKGLGCGVHMTISCNTPVLTNLKTIVDEEGRFFRRITDELLDDMDLDEIYRELCAQIDKASTYIDIDHLDSHHHIHTLKKLEPVITAILDKYKLPIRGGFEYKINYSKAVPLISTFYGEGVKEGYFESNLEQLKNYTEVEVMSHPAFLDDYILNSTSYAINRTKEYKILTSKKVKDYIKENFQLISYREF